MRQLIRNSVLVVAAILVSIWAVVPPKEKLRLGKDLRGGVSLIYSVQMAPSDNPREVMPSLLEVLKQRVDPQGQLDISLVPQGRDRVEITMPLPSPEIKRRRAEVEAMIDAVASSALDEARLDQLMRADASARSAEIDRLAAGNAARAAQMKTAADAFDAFRSARTALDDAKASGATDRAMEPLVEAAADAEIAYEQARTGVLQASITPEEIRRVLALSGEEVRKKDQSSATHQVVLPSPRAKALESLKKQHPESAEEITRIVQSWDKYQKDRKTLDDPEDLVRLLRGAGVLDFRITVDPGTLPDENRLREELRERGPRNVKATDVGWYKINRIENWFDTRQEGDLLAADPGGYFGFRGYVVEEYQGEYYMLCHDSRGNRLTKAEGEWRVAHAGRGQDHLGRPAISYEMDARGATLQAQLTGDHVGHRMAVLLDDQVYTAPVLNERIAKSGQISGGSDGFTEDEITYITRTLAAGSLQAKLSPEPISRDAVGPDFGADNLQRGLQAGVISFIVCAVFLTGYYFWCGLIASVALVVNCLLLIGVMAVNHWAFTLPGIAGVILTFAMAVDANVLIYERMREEVMRGADMKTAVRLGYDRALSAIVDGNVTNMIHCVVLIFLGTQEIRGFGITMAIGVLTTLFAQLVFTRVIFDILVDKLGWSRFRVLPLVVPAVQRAFDLRIDWMRYRPVFYTIFGLLVTLAVVMIGTRGKDLLDMEFRGGTSIRVQLKEGPGSRPTTLTRQQVDDRLTEYAEKSDDPAVRQLANADVRVINPESDGVTSSTFEFKTLQTDAKKVQAAVVAALSDVIDAQPALTFEGSGQESGAAAPAFPIVERVLGPNIERPDVRTGVEEWVGGVAIVLDNIQPPVPVSSLRARFAQTAEQPAFAGASARPRQVIVLDGPDDAVRSAVVVVRDPGASFFADQESWARTLRDPEWQLARTALLESTTLSSVRSFSPAIAGSFAARAIAAGGLSVVLIVIYVGVRFSSIRFSLAAITPTIMDCFIAVGLIAVAEVVVERAPGLAHSIGLEGYKIDLTMVAAILTILGYSINDKIVVLDRIRENRGKLDYVSRDIINTSLNQTLSRTIMTGMTTIISTFVLYLMGSASVRGFAYALGLGVICGTFSSVAIGAPMVWSRKADRKAAGGDGAGPGGGAAVRPVESGSPAVART